eukprot:Partr_v1_DN22245_c0_g1_i4_m59169 putative iron permease
MAMAPARCFFWLSCLLALYYATASSEEPAEPGEEAGEESGSSDSIFSVPAFFVVFREAVEASVILGVCLQFLDQAGKPEKKREVWWGAGLGLLLAIIFGVIFIIIFYVADNNLFSGDGKKIFEGILSWFASIIITVLAVSMLNLNKNREAWEAKLQAQLEKADREGAVTSIRKSQMFWIPFIAVLREGIETVIFLAGVGAGYPLKSIPIPGIIGLITGLAAGWLLFTAGGKCTMRAFLICSTVLLLFISAGLAMYGAHEFQEAGMFGAYENDEGEIQGAMNEPVWNICDCCNQADKGWDVFNRLFGYTCAPSPWEILVYCLYWVLALTYLCFKIRALCFRGLASKDQHMTPAKDMSP